MAHVHEKIDFTADAYIVYNNRVLLRMHEKYHMWLSVGGHIELDEDPNQTLIKEAREEVGLDIEIIWSNPQGYTHTSYRGIPTKVLAPPRFMDRHSISATHEHISFVYFARATSDAIKPGPGEANVACHWYTAEELENPIPDMPEDIRFYANQALLVAETEK